MNTDPVLTFLKQRGGMISQARHLGKTQSWIHCEFCHGFNDRL